MPIAQWQVHVALFISQLVASMNTIFARTAFIYYDATAHEEPVKPMVLAAARSCIATCVIFSVWFLGRASAAEVAPSSLSSGKGTPQSDAGAKHGIDTEGAVEVEEEEEVIVFSPSLAIPVPSVTHKNDDEDEDADVVITTDGKATKAAASSTSRSCRYRIAWDMRTFVQVSLLGIVGIPMNLVFYLNGVELTDAVTSAAFGCMVPVVCFIIARALNIDTMSAAKYAAVACVVVGNSIMTQVWQLLWNKVSSSSSSSTTTTTAVPMTTEEEGGGGGDGTMYFVGCLFFMGNVMTWSSYLVLQKPVLRKGVDRMDFLLWYYISGTVTMLLVVGILDPVSFYRQIFIRGVIGPWSWAAICYSGFLNATLPYYLIAYGIEHGGPVLASAWTTAQPVFVVIEAVWFLGEDMSISRYVGGAVVLIGLAFGVMAHMPQQQQQQQSTTAVVAAALAPAACSSSSLTSATALESPRHGDVLHELPSR